MIDIVKEMKDRVSMKDVLDYYGIAPKRSRNNYTCLFHSPDEHPSAGITKNGKYFHCFACGVTASIFDVVCHLEQCSFKQAMQIIDNNFKLCLLRPLSYKDRLEFIKQQKDRERKKIEQKKMERFEKYVLNEISQELRIWQECERITRISSEEYKSGEWKFIDLYFYSLKKQRWLNWLYDTIYGFQYKEECEFDYIYGNNKNKILEKIKDGEILI